MNFVDPDGLAPLTVEGDRPVRIKPENGNAYPPTYCYPGQTREVDGVIPEIDPEHPISILGNCRLSVVKKCWALNISWCWFPWFKSIGFETFGYILDTADND